VTAGFKDPTSKAKLQRQVQKLKKSPTLAKSARMGHPASKSTSKTQLPDQHQRLKFKNRQDKH
jgi:hypothetical protein